MTTAEELGALRIRYMRPRHLRFSIYFSPSSGDDDFDTRWTAVVDKKIENEALGHVHQFSCRDWSSYYRGEAFFTYTGNPLSALAEWLLSVDRWT